MVSMLEENQSALEHSIGDLTTELEDRLAQQQALEGKLEATLLELHHQATNYDEEIAKLSAEIAKLSAEIAKLSADLATEMEARSSVEEKLAAECAVREEVEAAKSWIESSKIEVELSLKVEQDLTLTLTLTLIGG